MRGAGGTLRSAPEGNPAHLAALYEGWERGKLSADFENKFGSWRHKNITPQRSTYSMRQRFCPLSPCASGQVHLGLGG